MREIYGKLMAAVLTIIILQVGCSAEIRKKDEGGHSPGHNDNANHGTYYHYNGDPRPVSQLNYFDKKCTVQTDSLQYQYNGEYATYYGDSKYICYESTDYRWRTSCSDEGCLSTSVSVSYMLNKDLGDNLTVHIEAFDNKNFEGYPDGTVEIRQFKGQTGYVDTAELYLPAGEYYLRAYINTNEEQPIPYTLEGMELIADKPMGVYGATSSVAKVYVNDWQQQDAVAIVMDQLFKKPGSEPETNARLRIKLNTENHADIEVGRKIYVELFRDTDFDDTPLYSFDMASTLLKIDGNLGAAEFLTPSINAGTYVVRVYLDANGDGFLDAPEIYGVFSENDVPRYVTFEQNHTKTISLELSPKVAI